MEVILGRRLSNEEKDARRTMRKARDLLQEKIDSFNNPNAFPVSDVSQAVIHAYSILGRFEKELEEIPSDVSFAEELEEIAITDYKDKTTTIPTKEYKLLVKKIVRLEAKLGRVSILNFLSKANRTLAQQISEREKVLELQKKQKFMEITAHAEILVAYNSMIYLALRRIGLTDGDIQDFADNLKNLERDYPLVKMNKEELVAKLTASTVPAVVDAEYTVIEEPPHEKLRKIDELL